MKPKKVLHVIPGYGGGISSTVRNLVHSIDMDKVINDVVGFTEYSSEFTEEIISKGGKLFTLKNVRWSSMASNMKEFCSLLQSNGTYDAVHIHITGYKGFYFSLLSRVCGMKRIIMHGHVAGDVGSEIWYNKVKMVGSRILTRVAANELASCSKISSEYLFGKAAVKKRRVMHIPNSINIDKFAITISDTEKKDIKNVLKIPDDCLVIGHIGRFHVQKNHDFMVRIIQRMKERKINFKWLFVGVGTEEGRIQMEVTKNHCSDVTGFLGRREDVQRLLQIMDVTVLPSHYEGLPTVTVETQAAGVPTVISSNVTDEVDMQVGLVQYLPLEAGEDAWIDAILEMSKVERPGRDLVLRALHNRGFTTESASKLYESYIWEKIQFYNLGEVIDFEISGLH